jgi:soluble P-type ATPase
VTRSFDLHEPGGHLTSARHTIDRQDSDAAVRLLKAIAVAHLYNQRAQAVSFGVSIALAVGGLLAMPGTRYGAALTLTGAVWAAVYKGVMAPWGERYLRIAATLQEMFDADLLGLPWNRIAVGDRIGDEEVSRLSRRYHGSDARLRGYYLVAKTAPPYKVLFCLEQNLAWGSRIRLRFAQMMLGILSLWSAVGVVSTFMAGATVSKLITGWFVPSLGLLLLCLEMYRTQMTSTRDRIRVLGLVRQVIDEPSSPVVLGAFALEDEVRPEARQAIAQLREQGVQKIVMITGDARPVAEAVAADLGFRLGVDEVFAEVLPADKDRAVVELQARGLTVAMVGDGVNDAPALARADVGIAIGAGTDVAIESAGVVLASSDPRGVTGVIRLSKASYRKMIQNLAWAAGYNVVAIPLAAGVLAWAGFTLSPAVGAILMSVSTIVVALNAQLLRRVRLTAD